MRLMRMFSFRSSSNLSRLACLEFCDTCFEVLFLLLVLCRAQPSRNSRREAASLVMNTSWASFFLINNLGCCTPTTYKDH